MSKAKITDADKFRNELRKADFASTRGNFKFSKNHHPIQDIYVREVIKEGKILTNKIVSVGLKDHSNVYVSKCKM
jgi:branched-chain amino acid transport system substrate-binding protein